MSDYRLLRLASAVDRSSKSGVRLDRGYARLFKGRFFRAAPNAPDPRDVDYGYGSIMVSF
ncbi:hypothetical protein EQZ23_00695 [Sphingomonas sp. UV9]|uniref:hypothetical protein n=1 Tax=Sphingomonas sp. UV9 TaxID=1851410 RepID=UPI000FFB6156|nr:hypothetical protein [Sphingomonas sp. UV9]RXD06673.1 hypothetical protein EQZ23_00695 [Sphingomonas sp. UV9]